MNRLHLSEVKYYIVMKMGYVRHVHIVTITKKTLAYKITFMA